MVQKIVVITEVIDRASGKLKKIEKEVRVMKGTTEVLTKSTKDLDKGMKGFKTTMKKTTTGVQKFKAEFLSVLFLGMAITRLFGRIEKAALTTFRKVTESTSFWSSAVGQLSIQWTFLKFVIGDAIATALEPLLPLILPIIEAIIEWVQNNRELTAAIILGGVALGAFLTILGVIVLGFLGLKTVLLEIIPAFGNLSLILSPLGVIIALIVALLAIMAIAFAKHPKALNPVKEAFSALKDTLGGLIRDIFPSLKNDLDGVADKTDNWALIAVTLAKGIELAVLSLNLFIQGVRDLILLLRIVANGFNLVNKAIFGSKDELELASLKFTNSIMGMKGASDDTIGAWDKLSEAWGRDLPERLEALKQAEEEAAEETNNLTEAADTTAGSFNENLVPAGDAVAQAFGTDVAEALKESTTKMEDMQQGIEGEGGGGGLSPVLRSLNDVIENSTIPIVNTATSAMNAWEASVRRVISALDELASRGGLGGVAGRLLGSRGFQTGGIVPNTGMFMLHQGERVIPANQVSLNGGVNVNVRTGPVSSDVNVRDMANMVSKVIVSDIRRYTTGKTRFST